METLQNVRGELNSLEVGQSADFPIERYEYVLSCRTKLQKTTGKTFASSTTDNKVRMTRTN